MPKDATFSKSQRYAFQLQRSQLEVEAWTGINLEKQSAKNIKGSLRFLRSRKQKMLLSNEEQVLFNLIIQNLTMQSAVPNIQTILGKSHDENTSLNGHKLLSVRHRQERGDRVVNRRIKNINGANNSIYFVTGIGEHPNTPSLQNSDFFRINLNKLQQNNPLQAEGLFVSPHSTALRKGVKTSPILLDEVKLIIRMDGCTNTIVYHLTKGGQQKKIIYSPEQFMFSGSQVLPGIAFRFIELLDYVGGNYQNKILQFISDPKNSHSEKIKRLSVAMTTLLPGWLLIEGKIFNSCDLHDTYTEVVKFNGDGWEKHVEAIGKNRKYIPINLLKHSMTQSQTLRQFFSKDLCSMQVLENFSTAQYWMLVDEPFFKGEHTYFPYILNELLCGFIQSGYLVNTRVCDELARFQFPDPRDPNVRYLIDFGQRSYSGIPSPVADVITDDDDVPFTVVEHFFRHNMLDVESDLNFCLYSFLGVDTRKKEVDFLLSLSTGLRDKYAEMIERKLPMVDAHTQSNLKKKGLIKAIVPPKDNQEKRQREIVVVIVKGKKRSDGEEYVILGQRENNPGKYCFPGGLVEESDSSIESAAIRELKEETCVDLRNLLNSKKIAEPKILHHIKQYDYESREWQKVYFVLFDIDMELSNSLVCSGDDFILANLVLLKGPMRCFKDAPIRYSNRLILEDLLKSNNVSDTTKNMLDDIVALENFPKEHIGIAIQSKRTDLLELVPQILLPSEVEYCDNYKYKQLAEATGEPVVIECVNQLNKVVYEMVESYFIREQARHQLGMS